MAKVIYEASGLIEGALNYSVNKTGGYSSNHVDEYVKRLGKDARLTVSVDAMTTAGHKSGITGILRYAGYNYYFGYNREADKMVVESVIRI